MRALLRLSLLRCAALALLLAGSAVVPTAAQPVPAEQEPAPEPVPRAEVVLIGEASRSFELSDVIAELLARQGVQPHFETADRFEPSDWLEQSPSDARTFAFVSVREPLRAQLYFRGPRGERFLSRQLELRNGLDEVGRELIARVVETSVVALLRSSEGMSREEARAELHENEEPPRTPATPIVESIAPPPAPPRWRALLGLRVLGHYTGAELGARAALGLEGGAELRHPGWPRVRARLSVEAALPQTFERDGIAARVITLPIRAGIDLGTPFDLYFGLSTGFDVVHLDPESVSDGELKLVANSTVLVASSRAEIRYELHVGNAWWLAISALADVPWTTTRYDVQQAGTLQHLATPWPIQPGLALTLGLAP